MEEGTKLVFGKALNMEEGPKSECRKTLIHINKGKAYGRHQWG